MNRLRLPSAVRLGNAVKLAVAIPAAVLLLVFITFVIRGARSANVPNLHAPPDVPGAAPSNPTPTSSPDLTGVQLAAVDGTTTLPPPRVTGSAHLSGVVRAVDVPVAGAIVRAERALDDGQLQRFDVVAGGDGRWDLANVPGGRYRVRAFLPPSLAQTTAEVQFVPDGEQRSIDLSVERFDVVSLAVAVAPDPPVVGAPVNLVVQVAARVVDGDGIVRTTPTPGYIVSLASPGSWVVRGSSQVLTGEDGQATFTMQCRSAGPNEVQVVARTADVTKSPLQQAFQVPDCVGPPPGATTPPPPSQPSPTPSTAPTTTQPTPTTRKR